MQRAYLRWLHTQGEATRPDPEFDLLNGWLIERRELHARRAPGNTCLRALIAGGDGAPDRPINDSKGCGGVMRVAPVGLLANDPFKLGCEVAAIGSDESAAPRVRRRLLSSERGERMPTIWVTPPEPPRWEALTVCPRCGGLYETWHPGGPDLAQLCTCMGRRRQPPWPRIDFDERWTLCACCAGVMIRSGSWWAELHCTDCISQVQEHNARRGTPVPIGGHSAMHGVILGKDWGEVSELDRFADGMMSFHAAVPLLLVAGEIFVGLKQNRVLNTTILVAAAAKIPIPVSCVEQGRWHRATQAARRGDYHLSPAVRAAQARTVAENVRLGGEFRADQGQVWASVGDALAAHEIDSDTEAFTDLTAGRGEEIRERMTALRPKPCQAGVLAAVGGEPTCADVFDRATTMERLWDGLVGSYLTDALVGRDIEGEDIGERAEAWLHALAEGEATEHPGVGLGRTVEITSPAGTVTALVVDETVVHLAALPRA